MILLCLFLFFDFAFVVVIKFISQFGVIFWLAFSLVAFCLADLQNKICFLMYFIIGFKFYFAVPYIHFWLIFSLI